MCLSNLSSRVWSSSLSLITRRSSELPVAGISAELSLVEGLLRNDLYTIKKQNRKSPARSRAAYIRARIVDWDYKPWLLFGKCFPDERLGWLVYEIQHLPIYIYLQAMACKRGWLEYENGLSIELFFQTNICLAQT